MVNKTSNEMHLMRGSLPVFPDLTTAEKDPALFPYLVGVRQFQVIGTTNPPLILRQEWQDEIHKSTNFKLNVTPKFDGSMFNLTFHPYGKFPINSTFSCKYGYLFFGSKNRFIAGGAAYERIMHAIKGSYGSIDSFIDNVVRFIEAHNFTQQLVCLHFEAIDAIPTKELTVYYGHAWCPMFGYTVFDDFSKKFYLPEKSDMKVVTPIFEFNTWDEVIEFYNTNYTMLLDGKKEIEPEGYVVHIIDGEKWIPVKVKYEFYYIAHKPNSKNNFAKAQQIIQEQQFDKLRSRLAKFRDKPTIKDLLSPILTEFIASIPSQTTKKEWALYWKGHKEYLKQLGNTLAELIKTDHPNYCNQVGEMFKIIMLLHGKEINVRAIIKVIEDI